MGALTDIGRAAMAKAIKEQSIFLALGTGSPEWGTTPPDEDPGVTALLGEVGRRALTRSLYVVPDEDNGTIEVPTSVTVDGNNNTVVSTQKFSVSETPTRHVFVEFQLDFADAAGVTVRELGVYIGCVLRDDLPPGKMFFVAADFVDNGLLFQIEHREPTIMKPDTRNSFKWVISV
jgi:hypothetical protein